MDKMWERNDSIKRILNDHISELLFLGIMLIGVFITIRSFTYVIGVFLAWLIVTLMKENTKDKLPIHKKYLYAAIVAICAQLSWGLVVLVSGEYLLNHIRLLLLLINVVTLSIIYLFRVRLRDYHWKITWRWVIVIIMIYGFIKILPNIHIVNTIVPVNHIASFVRKIYYPAINEELIYRGLLLNGLLYLGLSKKNSLILHSIIFGAVHILNFQQVTWAIVISVSGQALLGLIFGKIYLKTKSLTPGILLHALLDAVI